MALFVFRACPQYRDDPFSSRPSDPERRNPILTKDCLHALSSPRVTGSSSWKRLERFSICPPQVQQSRSCYWLAESQCRKHSVIAKDTVETNVGENRITSWKYSLSLKYILLKYCLFCLRWRRKSDLGWRWERNEKNISILGAFSYICMREIN